jgi:hypothetical protein
MTGPRDLRDAGRLERVERLRSDWRSAGSPEEGNSSTEEAERRGNALVANDGIRAEAPDDTETRRRADQLEREIKGARSRKRAP